VYGGNNPAEELALIHNSGVPYYVHINDNDGKWDWDFFAGSHHYLAYVEFLYYLKKFNYQDYITSDTSPTRWDINKMFEINNRITTKLFKAIDRMEEKGLQDVLESRDYMKIWEFLEIELFNLR
jgi:xylose isomerase